MAWKEVPHPTDDLENFEGEEDKTYRILVRETNEVEYEYRGTLPGQNYESGDVVNVDPWGDANIMRIVEEVTEDGQ